MSEQGESRAPQSEESGLPPLAGVKVIELTTVLAGPGLGLYLADQGADILKIEPLIGDPTRGPNPRGELTPGFMALNRNKRGMALNIRVPEGKAILERLIDQADVVTENFRPGILERQGLEYEAHRARNPRLIWVSITGYGENSPYRELRGYDLTAQAIAGTLAYRYWPDGTPMYSGIPVGDNGTGIVAMQGVMMALYQRERTGRGQKVSANLLSAAIAIQRPFFVHSETQPATTGYHQRKIPWMAPYRCSDGKYIEVALNVANEWADLCRTLDLVHIIDDPRYAFPPHDAAEELMQLLAGVFETRTSDEWVALLNAGDVPVAVISTAQEALQNENLRVTGQVIAQEDPTRGRYWFAGPSVWLADNPPRSDHALAPRLGEHTADVLAGLGFSPPEIQGLAGRGVVLLG